MPEADDGDQIAARLPMPEGDDDADAGRYLGSKTGLQFKNTTTFYFGNRNCGVYVTNHPVVFSNMVKL